MPLFFRDKIDLKFKGRLTSHIVIYLYDISGKILYKKVLSEPRSIIIKDKKLEKLPRGIYFLKIKSDKKELGKFKLIKK